MKRTLTDRELDESKQYAMVTMQKAVVKRRLDELVDEFDSEDFHAVFRKIGD